MAVARELLAPGQTAHHEQSQHGAGDRPTKAKPSRSLHLTGGAAEIGEAAEAQVQRAENPTSIAPRTAVMARLSHGRKDMTGTKAHASS